MMQLLFNPYYTRRDGRGVLQIWYGGVAAHNREVKKSYSITNGCHGYTVTSSQSAKIPPSPASRIQKSKKPGIIGLRRANIMYSLICTT